MTTIDSSLWTGRWGRCPDCKAKDATFDFLGEMFCLNCALGRYLLTHHRVELFLIPSLHRCITTRETIELTGPHVYCLPGAEAYEWDEVLGQYVRRR